MRVHRSADVTVRNVAVAVAAIALTVVGAHAAAGRYGLAVTPTVSAVVLVAALALAAALTWAKLVLERPSHRTVAFVLTTAVVLGAALAVAMEFRTAGTLSGLASARGAASVARVVLGVVAALVVSVAAAVVAARSVAAAGAVDLARRLPRLRFWPAAAALTVLWLPALIALAPGSTSYDSTRQIDELIGAHIPELDFTYTPTNHHPWFATVWQGTLLQAGMAISGGDVNVGLLLHTIVLAASSIVTYALVSLRVQRLAGPAAAYATVIWFGVFPHFANYAALYEKTGWYQLALIWFVLGVVDVAMRSGTFATQLAQLVLGGIGTALFRSNGLYVVAGTLAVVVVVLIARAPRDRRRVGVAIGALAGVVAVSTLWSSQVLPRLGVTPASPGEALVVPFQQVARIVVDHGDELTAEQRAVIERVMPYDRIAAAYQPENGDEVKALYEIDSFLITDQAIRKMQDAGEWWNDPEIAEDRSAFLRLWVQLVLEYPATAVSATLNNVYLYVAPPLDRGGDVSLFTGGLPDYFVLANQYTDDYRHLAGETPNSVLWRYYQVWGSTPGLQMLVNPGIYGWIVIAFALSLCFWPSRARWIALTPVVLVFLINFAGARNGDFRYTVPLLALLPLVLAVWWATSATGVSRHRSPAPGPMPPSASSPPA